jgi:hypothetical protein
MDWEDFDDLVEEMGPPSTILKVHKSPWVQAGRHLTRFCLAKILDKGVAVMLDDLRPFYIGMSP